MRTVLALQAKARLSFFGSFALCYGLTMGIFLTWLLLGPVWGALVIAFLGLAF